MRCWWCVVGGLRTPRLSQASGILCSLVPMARKHPARTGRPETPGFARLACACAGSRTARKRRPLGT
eukprot:12374456-Alexandrium_andersonii.AAC.1